MTGSTYNNPPPLTLNCARLDGRVIMVTGASSGIGAAAVRRFAMEGAIVYAAARRVDHMEAMAAQLAAEGLAVRPLYCDVRYEPSVVAAIATIVDQEGRIDGGLNNAAITGDFTLLHEMDTESFDSVIATNLRGVFLSMKHQIAAMLRGGHRGSIVNTSSTGGLIGSAFTSAYSASKFALEGLVRCAALEYARNGIRINAIAPGPTDTEMLRAMQPDEAARALLASQTPMNHIAHPDDIARCAAFLLSDEARWTTGATLPCEGGLAAGPQISPIGAGGQG